MSIRQLQIAHDAVQDRLLLRVATQADEEFRVWLTRRLLRELWPHLAQLAASPAAGPAPAGQSEAPHFEEPFRNEPATFPLGSNPLLTSEIKVDTHADGPVHLTFREGRERSFELTLTVDLLHALRAMLRAGAEQAHWDLALDYTRAVAAPTLATPPATPPHSLLH